MFGRSQDNKSYLNDLFDKCGSDKGKSKHNFGSTYERYLNSFRNSPISFLEIGVLTGCSLRAWREYFPEARIFGLDINPTAAQIFSPSDRISVHIGSQNNTEVLERVVKDAGGNLTVVIDDGSNVNEHIINTFVALWPSIAPGGIYVIEDLKTSYYTPPEEFLKWPGMRLNTTLGTNHREVMDQFFSALISNVDFGMRDIESIHFHQELAFIVKRGT